MSNITYPGLNTLDLNLLSPVVNTQVPLTALSFLQVPKTNLNVKSKNGNQIAAIGTSLLTDLLSDGIISQFGDSEFGRGFGSLFSSGLNSAGNTITNNLLKGLLLTEGLSRNTATSLAGTASELAANYIGRGINALGGDSMLSRGLGQGVATGLGTVGGQALSNLVSKGSVGQLFGKGAGMINPYGLAMTVVGSGLGAAFGPSKEYGGEYGGITKTLDTVYDAATAAANFIPGAGLVISGAMTLNKGLSNIFGSTSGMTRQDAILGSAFMPAPVKWLNMAGAKKTGTFNNLSWQNTEKTNSFMGNAFGNLSDKFDQARREAGKTYGTFSRGSYKRALRNLDFANNAWDSVLAMADLNELLNIRSLYMTSINNQRYAQMIQGGWNPIYRGKQGMKIFNNATNHNMGMRLLSAAALIDDKQMILSAQSGTKVPKLKTAWQTLEKSDNTSVLKPNIFRRPDGSYFYKESPSSKEINVTPMNTVFDDPSQWTYVDDEGRQYTPHLLSVNNTGTITQGESNNSLVRAANNYLRELAYRSTYDPSSIALLGKYTMPAIAASALLPWAGEAAYPLLTNPYVDAAATSAFVGHGLNHAINEGINGIGDAAMTALEVAPLGRLAKPLYEGVVQPGMRLFNSPLTGNWTKIGNREYRLSPNSLGVNGSPIESRKIVDYSTGIDLNKIRSTFENYEKGLTQYKGAKLPNPLEYKLNMPEINIDFNNLTTDNFVDYLSKQTGRTLKRVPIKDTNHGDIYNEGFAFIDKNGKEVAHIAGTRKSGKNVWVESSFVDPKFRYKGLGKQMYFDLNDHVFGTYGTTLHSDPMQRVGSTGVGMSPSNRLWKSLREKGLSSVKGEGFNRYDVMAEPSKITTAYRTPATPQITAENAASVTPEQLTTTQYNKLYSFDRPKRRSFEKEVKKDSRYISDLEIELYLDKLNNLSGVSARQMLEDAKTYWTSPERKAFNEKLKQEAKDMGYLTEENIGHPSKDGSLYALWKNTETPGIKMEHANFERENIPKGEYDSNTNTIMLRTNRGYLDPYIAYHEGLHAYGASWPGRALFSDTYKKAGTYPYKSVINTQNFRQAKIDAIRNKPKNRLELKDNSLSFKDFYNSDPDEFVAYGLTTGKKLGIKPFQKMPSIEEALKLWQDAIEIEPYLKRNVRIDAPIEDKWSLLNGTFLNYGVPAVIGGSTAATLYNKSK